MNPHHCREVHQTINQDGMIIYHVFSRYDENNCALIVKDSKTGTYIKMKEYWGSVVIFNKKERSEDKYAILLDPNGIKCHNLTRATFQLFKGLRGTKHIYVDRLPEHQFEQVLTKVGKMSREQLDTLCNSIQMVRNTVEDED